MTRNHQPPPRLNEIEERLDDCKKHGWLKKWADWMGLDYPTATKKWSTTESGEGYHLKIAEGVPELWACYMADLQFGESVWAVLSAFRHRFRSMYPVKESEIPSIDAFDLVNHMVDTQPVSIRLPMVRGLLVELAKKEAELMTNDMEDSPKA